MKRVAEAERRVAEVPVVVEPVPVQNNLAAVLVEIRDVDVAVAVPHKMCEVSSMSLLLEYSRSCI